MSLVPVTCVVCKCLFSIPRELFQTAQRSDAVTFFCPYGHALHFPSVKQITKEKEEKSRQIGDNVISMKEYREKLKGDL